MAIVRSAALPQSARLRMEQCSWFAPRRRFARGYAAG